MIINYLDILYLALPAFVANAAPVLAARFHVWPSLAVPVDGGKIWRGKQILGPNKTWRGVLAAVVGASFVALIQFGLDLPLFVSASTLSSIFYSISYGALVGFLCMFGDMVGSFIKRMLSIPSGKPFIPLDQIDYMFAYLFGTWFIFMWGIPEIIFLLVFALFINLATNALAYALGLKPTHW